MELETCSEQETEELGARLSRQLRPGQVVALYGGLGMGKTALTRGIARGLGIRDRVTSPTFAIVNEYDEGRLPLFHFDLYRLEDAEALYEIGWEDYLRRGGVCVTEWSENAQEAFPENCIRVTFQPGDTGSSRRIRIEGATL